MIALQNDLLKFYLVRIDFYWLWVSERTFICFWQFYGVWKSSEKKNHELNWIAHVVRFSGCIGASSVAIT